MTDVAMRHTEDGGEIDFVDGRSVMSDGLFNAVYLSLFGGNERDGGGDDTAHLQWWGNLIESDPAAHYRSETQYLLRSIPAIPANLRRLEDAIGRDLAWMVGSIVDSVTASATIPGIGRVNLVVELVVDGNRFAFDFPVKWSSPQ